MSWKLFAQFMEVKAEGAANKTDATHRIALERLHRAGHTIALVLTQPDRPAGRGLARINFEHVGEVVPGSRVVALVHADGVGVVVDPADQDVGPDLVGSPGRALRVVVRLVVVPGARDGVDAPDLGDLPGCAAGGVDGDGEVNRAGAVGRSGDGAGAHFESLTIAETSSNLTLTSLGKVSS